MYNEFLCRNFRCWHDSRHSRKGHSICGYLAERSAVVDEQLIVHLGNIDLPFDDFPGIDLAEVDLFTIELVSTEAKSFLVDDLQLIGRWKLEIE